MKDFFYQMKQTSDTLTVRAVFYGLLLIVLFHFLCVVNRFWGSDISEIYEPMKLRLMVDTSNPITLRLVQLFPFIVVIPAGFSYMNDKDNDTDVLVRYRMGNHSYVRNKILSSFFVSFFVYWIPFMIEIALLVIAIGQKAAGDPSNISDYQPIMQENINNYLFKNLYESNKVIYAVFSVTMWAVTVGALGCFSVCASLFGLKLRAFLFIPVYVVIYAANFLGEYFKLPYTTNYMWYMFSYDSHPKNDYIIWIFDLIVLVICFATCFVMERRDRL